MQNLVAPNIGRLLAMLLATVVVVSCTQSVPVVSTAAPVAATALPGNLVIPPGMEKELVWAGSAGGFVPAWQDCIFGPLEKLTGIKSTQFELDPNPALARIIAEKGRETIDFHVASADLDTGKKAGVYAKNDPKIMTNLVDIAPQSLFPDNIGLVSRWGTIGLVYLEDKFKENNIPPPTSYQDLFRPELKGRIALVDFTSSVGPLSVMALAKTFGSGPTDANAGFDALKRLKPNVLTYGTLALVDAKLQSGEVWIAFTAQSRTNVLLTAGVPVKLVSPKEGGFGVGEVRAIVEGAPHPLAAQVAMNYSLSVPAQECMASEKWKVGAPVNVKAKYPPALAPEYTTIDDMKKLNIADSAFLNTNVPAWRDRFNKEIIG